jgi:DNA-binding MarR family transcriptional regulator
LPPRSETALADQEAYNTVIATLKMIRHVALELFADEGITEPQLQALELLVTNGPMLMRKISDALLVTPANITGIVDRLEEKKLVKRTLVKGDRRSTIVEVTPEGKTLHEKVARKKSDRIQKSLSLLTKDERITLIRLLEKFQRGMSHLIDKQD